MTTGRALSLAVLCLLAPASYAQQTSIAGTITDSSGAVVADATVRATPVQGGAGLVVLTSKTGTYQFPSLVAADYVVRAETPGFAPAERTISLLVGQSLTLDFQLRPAQANTTVQVMGEGVEVNVTTSQLGGTVDPIAPKSKSGIIR
jgi:hypothetical protein